MVAAWRSHSIQVNSYRYDLRQRGSAPSFPDFTFAVHLAALPFSLVVSTPPCFNPVVLIDSGEPIMRNLVIASMVLLLSAGSAPAGIERILWDDCDDATIVRAVHEQKDVVKFQQKLDDFEKKLFPLKEKDFIALFGKSQAKPPKTYAMPVAQSRGLVLSGLRSGDPKDNKDHTEFYVIKDVAALEVWYQINGESPAAVIFYFPTDKDFPKLTNDNLAKRLAWDDDHFKKLVAHFDKRMVEVFPWEIDQKELARLHEGDFAVDAKTKLEAWIESGKKLGYTYKHEKGSKDWRWYRADGKEARVAYQYGSVDGDGPPQFFIWKHEGGGELRSESFSNPSGELTNRRWCRPKTTLNIRYESPSNWCWYGKDGKPVREEWDDNGDGIPDWYITKEDKIEHVGDRKAMEKRKPLKLEESWAINPKLIPEESRISDQPDLRVPIRRKVDKPTKD
jgi:hypothetical protein